MNPRNDIIAAIVTPIGEGGTSVLRVSGKGAVELSGARFRGKKPLTAVASHTAHYGHYLDSSGELVDEVVATVFRAPQSYTAEDTVEFSCHGGAYLARRILESLRECGARLAEPGEFTKRAFLNGRIDLSQAEAIADLIRSRSEKARRIFIQQLSGSLSTAIREMRECLVEVCGLVELELDFAEEGIELADKSRINNELSPIIKRIDSLLDSYRLGRLYREGVKVVIAGRTNVGKSSILNALLKEDRAIVSEFPGTTRDFIREGLSIGGVVFTLTDTAGLRESDDFVEREGIIRTEKELSGADIILFIAEPEDTSFAVDSKSVHGLEASGESTRKLVLAVNKMDLNPAWKISPKMFQSRVPIVYVSAKTGSGLETLREQLLQVVLEGEDLRAETSVMITNDRHRERLLRAKECLALARRDAEEGRSNEFIAVSLREALDSLGEIIGQVTTDEILDRIFSSFCIGK